MEKSKLCSKKLKLSRETLRRLTTPELESAVGGLRMASAGGATCQTSIKVSCQVTPVD